MILTQEQTRRALHHATALSKLGDGWAAFSAWVTGIKGHTASKVRSFTNTAGIIHTGSEHIIVFPGTDDPEDILIDLSFAQEVSPYGKIHRGFYEAWRGYEAQISAYLTAVDPHKVIPISVSGHSLGAAMALLAGNLLSSSGYIVKESFVFGAPRVGDKEWVASVNSSGFKVCRIINDQDIITRVPWFLGYKHVGSEFYLDKKGNGRESRPFSPMFWLIGSWAWALPFSIIDHRIKEYIRKLGIYFDRPKE